VYRANFWTISHPHLPHYAALPTRALLGVPSTQNSSRCEIDHVNNYRAWPARECYAHRISQNSAQYSFCESIWIADWFLRIYTRHLDDECTCCGLLSRAKVEFVFWIFFLVLLMHHETTYVVCWVAPSYSCFLRYFPLVIHAPRHARAHTHTHARTHAHTHMYESIYVCA